MKWFITMLLLSVCCGGSIRAAAELQLVAPERPQCIFGGNTQTVCLRWHNSGTATSEIEIQKRIMQLTPASAVRIEESSWKTLQVLPGQTILETAALEFPAVRAKTRFLVQWFDGNSNVLGSTDVLAYPTNLLAELGVLVGHAEDNLGVYDPENQLKPFLRNLKVGFVDLENMTLENYRGKLAIIGPFDAKRENRFIAKGQIKTLSENSVAVVWIQPLAHTPDSQDEDPQPSFYSVTGNKAAVLVVQPKMVSQLATNPRSQLNLIYFCKLALHPQPLTLPSLKQQLQL